MPAVTGSGAASVELRLPFEGAPAFRITGSARDESIPAWIRAQDGLYEPEVLRALRPLVPADAIVIDVGANLGALAIPLAWMASRGTVYAFEPAPANFAYLRRNLADNHANNVVAINAGCHSSAATLEFHYIEQFAGGSFVAPSGFVDGREERVRVECVTLDAFAAARRLPRVDAIKIDVEGAEEEVLAGAEAVCRRLRPHLVVEFNPATARIFHGRTLEGLHGRLRSLGYALSFLERHTGNPAPCADYAQLMERVERQGGVGDVLASPS